MPYTTKPLHAVTGRNRFCGPAALSTVSGFSTDECARVIRDCHFARHARSRGGVKGTSTFEMMEAFRALGYFLGRTIRPKVDGKRPTLAAWLRSRTDRRATFLVMITGHWVVVRGNKFCDSFTREPVNLSKAPHRRCRVVCVRRIERDPEAPAIPPSIQTMRELDQANRRRRNRTASLRRKAKALGITIEREFDGWWVWPPEGMFVDEHGDPKDDPLEGQRYAVGEIELAECLSIYVEAIEARA